MQKIKIHPILEVPKEKTTTFQYNGKEITADKDFTIAAALHQAGYPVHSHSLENRNRSLECGIGKCGACEMLVDGVIRRICITKTHNVQEVKEIPNDYEPDVQKIDTYTALNVFKTDVVIIGAGPAGLAAREILNEHTVNNIVIDNNDQSGGQLLR